MSLALWSVKLCFRGIDSWISSNCRWYGGIFSPLLFIETDLVIHNAFCQSKFPVVHKSTCWLASNRALTLHLKLPTPSRLINQNTGQFNLVPLSSLLYPSFVLSLYMDSLIMTIWNHMEIDMKNYITNFILWIQCLIWHLFFLLWTRPLQQNKRFFINVKSINARFCNTPIQLVTPT